MSNLKNDMLEDALTHFMTRSRFDTKIHKHSKYCDSWAIDTSGTGQIPFHLISSGRGWLHVDGCEAKLLQSGDLVLFPRDIPHAVSNSEAAPDKKIINAISEVEINKPFTSILCGFYIFESDAAQLMLNDLEEVVIFKNARNNPATAGLGNIIEATMHELENDYPGRASALCDLARLLLLHLLRDRFSEGSMTGYLAALSDPGISRALLLIHSRFNEDWSLVELAREAGMSRTSFANKFNRYVGMPAARYLSLWRMQEATTLLKTSLKSIAQIAQLCGYQSVVSFSKAYKKTTGKTPKQMRSQFIKELDKTNYAIRKSV
jgi:AraC-like DNA-binding protein